MTATHPHLAALHAAILADPADDSARLVYADALEEAGQGERGAFIRVQVALEQVSCHGCRPGHPCGAGGQCPKEPPRRRALALLAGDYCRWGIRVRGFTSHYRRGFVEAVRCAAADWLAHGPAIVRAHPVTRVDLGDKRPIHFMAIGFWRWFNAGNRTGRPGELPAPLWRFYESGAGVEAHRTEGDALDALSAACLAYAREGGTP